MSQNNPYGSFNPQAANFMQQQRFAAFQRQMQEMGGRNMQQFPPTSNASTQPNTNDNVEGTNSSTPTPQQQKPATPQPNDSTPTPREKKSKKGRSNTPKVRQSCYNGLQELTKGWDFNNFLIVLSMILADKMALPMLKKYSKGETKQYNRFPLVFHKGKVKGNLCSINSTKTQIFNLKIQ